MNCPTSASLRPDEGLRLRGVTSSSLPRLGSAPYSKLDSDSDFVCWRLLKQKVQVPWRPWISRIEKKKVQTNRAAITVLANYQLSLGRSWVAKHLNNSIKAFERHNLRAKPNPRKISAQLDYKIMFSCVFFNF